MAARCCGTTSSTPIDIAAKQFTRIVADNVGRAEGGDEVYNETREVEAFAVEPFVMHHIPLRRAKMKKWCEVVEGDALVDAQSITRRVDRAYRESHVWKLSWRMMAILCMKVRA